MASSRDRQRKLARAKLDRQMARRAGKVRRQRQLQAGVGAAAALLLIVAGAVWLAGGFDSDDPTANEAADVCAWQPQSATANTELKDVGTPPTKDIPTAGTRPLTITTNQGAPIVVDLDLAAAPCGSASLAYLAGAKFYNDTRCHEITTEGALRCGDPTGKGLGGPTYSVFSENTPAAPDPAAGAQKPLYPAGTVALIGTPPGTNGSQFLIFFKDSSPKEPQYSIVGKVASGMDTLTKISKLPTVDNGTGAKIKPKTEIVVASVTAGDVVAGAAPSAPPASSGAAPSGSAAPAATGQS